MVIKNLEKIMQILSLLSKGDAMTIFLASKNGLKSRQNTHIKIGLTKKQYYSRLKQLVNLNLIEKQSKSKTKTRSDTNQLYTTTLLGNLIYKKCVLELDHITKNSKKLEAIDILNQNSRFSTD